MLDMYPYHFFQGIQILLDVYVWQYQQAFQQSPPNFLTKGISFVNSLQAFFDA
jgi:hypothetical protein